MTKILVMIPSGEVYNHDCVRWYNHSNISASIEKYHNIGDAFVYDSSLKLLSFDQLEVLSLSTVDEATIERINSEFDYVFLRGSNYINSSMSWWRALEVLPRLRIPVIAFGIGAQAPKEGSLVLSAETQRVLHLIADSSVSVGVRGAYTAEVLWDLGVRNTRIIGCPTAFRRNDPDMRIVLPPLESVRKVGFTARREVSADYAKSIELYLTRHRDTVKQMAARFDIEIMMQGEVEEKKLLWGTQEQKQEAWQALKSHDWMGRWFFDEEIEALWKTRLFYSDVVADYEDLVQTKDLVLGFRLHGNLMALSNGVPSVYFIYDSRTAEFADTFKIPSYNVYSDKSFSLEEYWDQSLFDRYNRAWFHNYRAMSEFLTENGVSHKMRPNSVRLRNSLGSQAA